MKGFDHCNLSKRQAIIGFTFSLHVLSKPHILNNSIEIEFLQNESQTSYILASLPLKIHCIVNFLKLYIFLMPQHLHKYAVNSLLK